MIGLQDAMGTDTTIAPASTSRTADRCLTSRSRLAASDGVSLHYRAWLPAQRTPEAAVLFVHGIASHGAWFAETAAHLANRGTAVYAADRRGSGLSGGRRGHLDNYEQALDDLDRVVSLVESRHPGTPLFLAGSSWAAKLAVAYAAKAQDRLAGLLLHGPGLFPKVDLSLPRKLAVLLYHRWRPQHQLTIPLTPECYTRNKAYLPYVEQDPYRLLTASARFFWETRRLDRARDHLAATLTLPILLQIGDADPIMDPQATCRWLQNLPAAADRTAILYRDASHTLDFESERTVQTYRADLLGWLRRQTRHRPAELQDRDNAVSEENRGR
ncbi:MAG: alpha/beta fold hydrolase [Chloroflexota bacterium]